MQKPLHPRTYFLPISSITKMYYPVSAVVDENFVDVNLIDDHQVQTS
jgi:hypothetical protein